MTKVKKVSTQDDEAQKSFQRVVSLIPRRLREPHKDDIKRVQKALGNDSTDLLRINRFDLWSPEDRANFSHKIHAAGERRRSEELRWHLEWRGSGEVRVLSLIDAAKVLRLKPDTLQKMVKVGGHITRDVEDGTWVDVVTVTKMMVPYRPENQ
jgi:hypothetical protein